MFTTLLNKITRYLKLNQHRREWRNHNKHNQTIASTFFPIGRVIVGKYTYGDLHIISQGEENEGLEIGHYVSIATGVTFLLGGNHYYKRFTNYPFIYKFRDNNYVETWSKGKISVEDDVWIGTEAFIMPGVKIGRGAIVGACSVVTKDIPPYAIVAGNPAVVQKFRFDEATIKKLLTIDFANLNPQDVLKDISNYQKEKDFDEVLKRINGVVSE